MVAARAGFRVRIARFIIALVGAAFNDDLFFVVLVVGHVVDAFGFLKLDACAELSREFGDVVHQRVDVADERTLRDHPEVSLRERAGVERQVVRLCERGCLEEREREERERLERVGKLERVPEALGDAAVHEIGLRYVHDALEETLTRLTQGLRGDVFHRPLCQHSHDCLRVHRREDVAERVRRLQLEGGHPDPPLSIVCGVEQRALEINLLTVREAAKVECDRVALRGIGRRDGEKVGGTDKEIAVKVRDVNALRAPQP